MPTPMPGWPRLPFVTCLLAAGWACGSSPAPTDDPPEVPADLAMKMAPRPVDGPVPSVASVDPPARPPHVLFVFLCTVRRDQLGLWGGPVDTAPFLSALAAGGTVFDDTIASAPWTRAAATAMLTGFDALSVGMVEPRRGRNERTLPPSLVTMAERFQEAGYLTVGNTANPNLDAAYGFEQGFAHYQEDLPARPKHKMGSREVVDALLASVQRLHTASPDARLYMQTVLIDPHGPRPRDEVLPTVARDPRVPDEVHLYRRFLRRLDDGVRHLVTGLHQIGIADEELLIVVVGDHGEGLAWPKHHGGAHGRFLTPSGVQVPWILHGPGVARDHRVLGLASQLDVTPTLWGVLGQPVTGLPGEDWSDLVRGHGHLTRREQAVSDTWFLGSNRAAIYTSDAACLHDFGSDKTATDAVFRPGCFDRHADPLFSTPVAMPALRDQLFAWRAAHDGARGAPVSSEADELHQALRGLGYVDTDADDPDGG